MSDGGLTYSSRNSANWNGADVPLPLAPIALGLIFYLGQEPVRHKKSSHRLLFAFDGIIALMIPLFLIVSHSTPKQA